MTERFITVFYTGWVVVIILYSIVSMRVLIKGTDPQAKKRFLPWYFASTFGLILLFVVPLLRIVGLPLLVVPLFTGLILLLNYRRTKVCSKCAALAPPETVTENHFCRRCGTKLP